MTRKLSLKREALQELTTNELTDVVAGDTRQTLFSCYTFVSCNPLDCLPSLKEPRCIE